MPGHPPPDFYVSLFWCCVSTVGHLYRRLIQPYRLPPLCLAKLVDPTVRSDVKLQLATWFTKLGACCLSKPIMEPLRRTVSEPGEMITGKIADVLQSTFACKNTNMTVENAFARAASMRACCRGRSDQSQNMWSKHVLAELKTAHRSALADNDREVAVFGSGDGAAMNQQALQDLEGLEAVDTRKTTGQIW